MSDVIDTSVVKLGFDNREFVNNVNMSIMAVDALKDSLVFDSSSFDSLTKAANNIDLSGIAANVQSLSDRFSTFGIVGMTAIERITNAAIDLGGKLVGLLAKPWKQIISGGWSRASNIGQAKFQLEGLFGKSEEGAAKLNMTMMATSQEIQQLTGYTEDMIVAMNAADYAVADTAYGLDSAAKAASVLATSGVDVLHFSEDLKDANGLMRTEMQVALRSISGVAAMANASYDEIAHVFERVSGNGRIMAIDLQSLSARGLNAAATLRDYLNEIGETANATEADIREMVSKGEIDFMTFAKAMDNAYGDHAKDANNTFSGAFSNMKFALSKIGADFISPIRNKMVPLFNDIRISINQVRKALNFKMKFPGLEEEISIVEMFTRVIHNLTSQAHDLFTMWHGGQNVMEQAMAGFANKSGQSLERIKSVFDRVTKGTSTSAQGIKELTDIAKFNGVDLNDVYKALGETFEKTDEEIQAMCNNGEISFEDFYRAMSSVFGSDIQDTRISQLATLIHNITQGLWNLAKTVAGIVYPIIRAFFQVFNAGGIKGIVGITEAFANFTATLVTSRETQEKIRSLAFNLFSILKSGISVVKKIASMIFKVAQALAPLIIQVLDFADVIASVVSYIVDIIVESKLLESVITVVGKAFQVAGYIIINVFRVILGIVRPVIKAIGEVFAFFARSVGSVDVSFIGIIIGAFENLANTLINGGLIQSLTNAVQIVFNTIERMFNGLTLSFEVVSDVLYTVSERISTICDRIVSIFTKLKKSIVYVFTSLQGWIKALVDNPQQIIALIGQLTSLTLLLRFAQAMRGIGRTFSGLGNYLNSNAILAFVNAIKTLARAVLEFSVAIVLLSSIPTDSLKNTITLIRELTKTIAIFLGMYFVYMYMIARLNNKIIADPMIRFMNKLNASINTFLQSIGRATNIAALGLLLIALAASLGLVFKAVKQFSEIDPTTMQEGFQRVGAIVLLLASFLGIVAYMNKSSNGIVGTNNSSIQLNNNSLMGAAVTLLALIIVLRAFEDVIKEYNALGISEAEWDLAMGRIMVVLAILATAIGTIGLTAKRAGFGLMASVSVMMGFLTVLQAFESILRLYAGLFVGENAIDPDTLTTIWFYIAGIIFIVVGGLALITSALTQGSTSLSASLKSGFSFESNSAKFIGIIFSMLALCLVLETAVSAMSVVGAMKNAKENAEIVFIILLTVLTGLAAITWLMKDVKPGSMVGLGVVLVILASVLPLLSSFDWQKIAASAISMSIVIAALSLLIHTISDISGLKATGSIVFMFFTLIEVMTALTGLAIISAILDPEDLVAAGMGLAMVIGAFAMMFMTISKFKYNKGTLSFMALALGELLPIMAVMSVISLIPYDPIKLVALVGTMSVLAVAIGGMMKIMSGVRIKNAKGMFVTLIGIAVSLSILAAALSGAAVLLNGNLKEFVTITMFINALIPIIVALGALTLFINRFKTTWTSILMAASIIGMVIVLLESVALIARFGDAEGFAIILKGLSDSVVGLIAFIASLAGLTAIFGVITGASGGIGGGALAIGLGLVAGILVAIGTFIGIIAASATLGDADATVTLLSGLGTSLDAMIPFLLKMGGICALFGVVSPLLAAGAVGFGVLLTVIAGFVGMIAFVAGIGNPEDTVTVLLGLTKAMDRFNEFLAHFMIVLTLLGTVAPIAAVGAMVFRTILDILSQFAMSMAVIGVTGNVGNTVTVMTSITSALKELVNSFLVLMVLGAMAVPVIAGMLMISTAMTLLLGVSFIIGQIDAIRNSILSGIMTILLSAESLVVATAAMNNIDLVAIAQFIMALALISAAPMAGISKFAMIATAMTIIGVSSSLVLKGSKTTLEMFKDLYASVELMNAITRTNTKGLRNITEDILQSAINLANVGEYIGVWVPYSIADGVVNSSGLQAIAAAGYLMAKVLEESIRDTMQIHSESPTYNGIGGWVPKSMGNGVLDNMSSLMNAGSSGMADFGGMMNNLAGMYGSQAGASYAENLGETLWETLEYVGQGYADLWNYFAGDSLTNAGLQQIGINIGGGEVKALSDATDANNAYAQSWYNIDEAEKTYINNNGSRPYFSPNLVEEVDTDEFDINEWMDDLLKGFDTDNILGSLSDGFSDVGSSIGGLDDDASSASKSVDELTKKIDNLMDKYEDLWDDAKERANKDLFKGVDKQGDDFLDSVQDIMDKFKNIYQDAVEKTNGEDLFAEVKDDEESFAPDTLLNNLEDQVNQVNELNTIISSLGGRIADNGLRAAISSMSVDDLPELRAMYRMDDSQLREYESLYKKKVQANQNKIQNELTGSLSQLTGQYTDVATYVATDYSTNALVRNLQSQIDQLNEYNSTVSSLTSRIKDVNLREAIAHMGTDSLEELKALNRMTDAQLDEYTAMYKAKIDQEAVTIKNELSTELSSLLNEPVDISEFYLSYRGQLLDATNEIASEAGQSASTTIGKATAKGAKSKEVLAVARNSSAEIVNEVGEGLSDEEGIKKIETNVKMILDNIKTFFEESNEDFKKIGTTIVEKICAGIDLGRRSAGFTNTLNDLKLAIANSMTVGYEVKWLMTGEAITNGIARGMQTERAIRNIENAARVVAVRAINAARNKLDIHSPSRVFMEIGRFIDEGFAIGLRDYSGLAEDEAGSMAEGSISAVQDAIQQLSGMLDGSIDVNPVITPTLDLSEVNARSAALANMFTGRQIAVQAYQDDQQAEMMTQLGNILAEQNAEPRTITFNQTNNSPKALSRKEIYRQTRNGFSQLASAIQ